MSRYPSPGAKLEKLTSRPCPSCGQPVTWMAMHRHCWRAEELGRNTGLMRKKALLREAQKFKRRLSNGSGNQTQRLSQG